MAYLGMSQYHGQMADEYDYDDVDDFYDNNHINNNSNNYNDAADDSEGDLKRKCQSNVDIFTIHISHLQIRRKRVSPSMAERGGIMANHLK